MSGFNRCYVNISLPAIDSNIKALKALTGSGRSFAAVVKADAYGHGAVPVSRHIEDKVDLFGVASVEEGVELRDAGISKPVLVLGYTSPSQYADALAYDISLTICNYDDAVILSGIAGRMDTQAKVHLAFDTGMTRLGFSVSEASEAGRIAALDNITIAGLFSHLSCADGPDDEYSMKQFAEFESIRTSLDQMGVHPELVHLCNSAGTIKYCERYYNCVRCGISIYGMYPSEYIGEDLITLSRAMEWKSHVVYIREPEAGRGVSYGATYLTSEETKRIAVVSVGYADGYPRNLSNRGRVIINGEFAPIIGRVCMDQIMVDISAIGDVRVEDTVTLIGKDGGNEITIEEIADAADSFNYEMATRISKRVRRIYV